MVLRFFLFAVAFLFVSCAELGERDNPDDPHGINFRNSSSSVEPSSSSVAPPPSSSSSVPSSSSSAPIVPSSSSVIPPPPSSSSSSMPNSSSSAPVVPSSSSVVPPPPPSSSSSSKPSSSSAGSAPSGGDGNNGFCCWEGNEYNAGRGACEPIDGVIITLRYCTDNTGEQVSSCDGCRVEGVRPSQSVVKLGWQRI
ncbi:MAG: hypothetical protein LBC75_13050 [Fibromonadaceae bacterium]|nr:hypothetical protein [Fibromonadaceae bacterium]